MIAEKYCPKLINSTDHVGGGIVCKVFVQRKGADDIITLKEWLDRKSGFLDWTLDLNKEATCLVKTRTMEDELFPCESGFVATKAVMT